MRAVFGDMRGVPNDVGMRACSGHPCSVYGEFGDEHSRWRLTRSIWGCFCVDSVSSRHCQAHLHLATLQVDCAQFVRFAGDGYLQWGPVVNSYSTFTCNVQCKNAVSSCPFIMCEVYHNNSDSGANQTAVKME